MLSDCHFCTCQTQIVVVTFMLVFMFAPVDHKHRRLSHQEALKSKNVSRVVVLVIIGLSILYFLLFKRIDNIVISTMMGTFTASISLAIGSIIRGVKEMKIMKSIRKYAGSGVACMALVVAQVASTQYSFIFYQDEVPVKVKALKK